MAQSKTYLQFIDESNPSQKTKRFVVKNVADQTLGGIQWYGPWRRYVFKVFILSTYDAGCLKEISEFLDQLMEERKKKK